MSGHPVAIGELLASKYRVERVLGQGGMGVVVSAMHEQLEQRVALKFLLESGAADPETLQRFLREAKAVVKLRSEHVAKVLDVGTLTSGSPYIVMEYLEGRDLSQVLDEAETVPVELAVTYVLQACEAVAEAHAAGIVHRDLKPANLFLTRRNDGSASIKVLDFGISKTQSPTGDMSLTKTSSMMGTPFYMAPEQMRSSRRADARSDLWALGMILYELVTGSVAFYKDTLPELCAAILTEPVPKPRERNPRVPGALEAVILNALEKDPERRYQNLAELADALAPFAPDGDKSAVRIARILGLTSLHADGKPTVNGPEPRDSGHLPRHAPSPGQRPSAPLTSAPVVRASAPMPVLRDANDTQTGTPKRSMLPVVLGGAALLVLGGAGIFLATRKSAPPPQEPDTPAEVTPAAAPPPASSSAPVVAPAPATTSAEPPPSAKPAASAPRPAGTPPGPGGGPAGTKKPPTPPVNTGSDFGGRK